MKHLAIATAAFALLTIAAFAHGGATGIVKERMDGMMAMGKALGSISDMFKGKTDFDPDQVAAAAGIVKAHASEMDDLFPDTPHSRKGKGTEALPVIWQKREEFSALASKLETQSAKLARIALTGDRKQIRAGFTDLLKTCSACHADYRKPNR